MPVVVPVSASPVSVRQPTAGLDPGPGTRRIRVFIAALVTETNVFVPFPTTLQDFEAGTLHRGDGSRHDTVVGPVLRKFRTVADQYDFDVVEGLAAYAEPSGRIERDTYEALRDELVGAARAGDPDLVLLFLHGAMAAAGEDDCEGDVLERLRAALPKAVIGALLDPHCHLTARMLAAATALVIAQEYPHTDFEPRAAQLARLCAETAAGRIAPVAASFDCRMLGVYPTTREPMRSFVAALKSAEEQPGVLAASLVHGFAYGDTPDTGARVLVVADRDIDLASRVATSLGRRFYSQRAAMQMRYMSIDEALTRAEAIPGLIVLADTGDNPGGGAPGDNTTLLAAMLARGMTGIVAGCFADPASVATCVAAGEGACVTVRIGSGGPSSGAPLEFTGVVRSIREAHDEESLGSSREALGRSVWIQSASADIALCSLRRQVYAPDAFTGLGIPLAQARYVALKSTQHFHARFAPIAAEIIYVATPGALAMDVTAIPYRRMPRDRFPFVPDPLALGDATSLG